MFKRTKKLGNRVKEGVARGMGLNYLTGTADYMKGVFGDFLSNAKGDNKAETFEQAMKRMKLTEADLVERRKNFLKQFFMFLMAAFIVLAISVYGFSQGSWPTGIVAFLMAVMLMVHALRAHFWAFQVKHRKLGCTLSEWWNNKIVEHKMPQR